MKFSHFSAFSFLLSTVLLFTACTSQTETVPVLSDSQKAYQLMPREERIAYFADAKKRQEMGKAGYYPMVYSIALPAKSGTFTLKEISQDAVRAKTIKSGTITIQIPAYLLAKVEKDNLKVQNLKIATRYQWTMNAEGKVTKGSFRTEDMPPRLMRIDGVPNVRDLGGRTGLNGRRIRQGKIYRTAGLNDNASIHKYTVKDILKDKKKLSPETLALIKEYQTLSAKIKKGEFAQNPDQPCKWDSSWTVFCPAGHREFFSKEVLKEIASWKEIPSEFHGVKAHSAKTNGFGIYQFPETITELPAVFVKVFDSPKDGKLSIGCGADWYLQLYVNGKQVFDTLEHGNAKWPIALTNHMLEINVRKGKNIIAAPMLSGNASFTFCCGIIQKEYTDLNKLEQKIREQAGKLDEKKFKGKNRLSPEMKHYLVHDLGVRSDIDLRSNNECYGMKGSPAGNQVTWFHYSSSCYGGMQNKKGKEAFKKVFRVFLNEKNYPIVFHCIAGQDRTGAVAFILNGLLGVSEEQLYLDWESTGYWNKSASFCHKTLFNHLVAGFETLPGKTLNEKIENYVYSLGFTKADVARFRAIMLEPEVW